MRNEQRAPSSGGPFAESTVDPAEIRKFERMAAEWWDPDGKFRPLHRLNPVRLGYIRDDRRRAFRPRREGRKTASPD